jgi:putative tryptophan/tyrosine transport system substrate-binding protein
LKIGIVLSLRVWAWSLAARAQQGERVRHIAILDGVAESDLEARTNLVAFVQELQQLGWSDGRNARFELRWGRG